MARDVDPEMLKAMLDALDFPVYTFSKDRTIIYPNRAARESIPGMKPGSPMGAAEADHFAHNQYFDIDGNLLDYPTNSAVDRALRGEAVENLILEHRNLKDHTHQWVSISCTPVMSDDGDFAYGILWYRNVSRKQSREHKLRFLLNATRVLMLTNDFRERLREKASLTVPTLADWCSIQILRRDGTLERVALVHRDPGRIQFIEDLEASFPPRERAAERVIASGRPEFVERVTDAMIDATPDLSEEQREAIRNLGLTSLMTLPIGEPGHPLGALTLAYAESGRSYTKEDLAFFEEFALHLGMLLENARLYDEIRQRDLYKDLFLASLSHELRNPLAPIKTSLELLELKHQEDAELAHELSIIDHQFDHMARLLNDLLDATRFVQGKIVIEPEPADLRPVVEHVAAAVRPLANDKGVALEIMPVPHPVVARMDRTRIEQALTNILNNAVKFTPGGGKITVAMAADADGTATISVKDTGAGITEEELDRIFEPYYQSERVKGGNSGLGIGLRLVYEIMRLHGGSIEVESEGPDLGSEFVLRLPLAHYDAAPVSTEDSPPVSMTESKNILIIDDNKAAADALVRLFTALGYNAVACYSAKDAFIKIDEIPADIIFADIGMPEMNGYDFVRTLRENGYVDVPVVALTGYGLEEDRQKALAAGFNDHLTKPVGAEDLKEAIASLTA